jgi:hypothetical protein
MWPIFCPSSEDFVTQQTLTKCGPNCAPHQRTLSCSGLQPNVAQIVPLVGGLCHAVDFDQMWPKMCPLSEDFFSLRTSTKCSPSICPSSEDFVTQQNQPNMVQTCAPQRMTSFCYRVRPHMDQQRTHHQKRLVPSNEQILILNQRRTKTAVSNYVAM